ncbi:MAG: SsrA-binding protein [Flavobacteriaceae bacterium]|nr:SsrA-binding protein [Flavobacteriaceae bacterium]
MKKQIFKSLAKFNKVILPSLGKKQIDMSKAKKWQMAIIGWRYFITKNSLD